MSGFFLLDWAIMAVSFFNTILLLWLGLTVLLNAERRSWGVGLSSGGLLVGGAFFFGHSVLLGDGLNNLIPVRLQWWYLDWSWIPVTALPFVWYLVILWYAGFWEAPRGPFHRRHRFGLAVIVSVAVLSAVLLLVSHPSLGFGRLTPLNLTETPTIVGLPLLVLTFPLYLLLCIGLSIDALRRPGPTTRVMGDLARRRARPWLTATAVLLLVVSMLVARGMFWAARNAPGETVYDLFVSRTWTLAHYDLVVAALIGLSILCLGQAIVSYEVFTGKTLPRRGLRRYWRNAVLLALGYGVAVGLSQLLATLLMILFYALLSWRSFAQRERYMAQLRPFVASERLYEQLVAPASPSLTDAAAPFFALCRDVLDTHAACLVAWGPLAPLVGPPLVYPQGTAVSLPPLAEIIAQFDSPQTLCVPLGLASVPLNGEKEVPALSVHWAVPLWSERGLVGVLLLGEKRDGSLYTQEEIEIACASGERLIDTQASTAVAARLMALQRQRLAESQVLDRQAHRALHDDILPRLHTAMLTLSSTPEEALDLLGGVHRQLSGLLHEMPASTAPEVARLGLIGALQWMVREEFGAAFDGVSSHIDPSAQQHAERVAPLHAEVMYYAAREAMRNAARHGLGTDPDRPLHLHLDVTWKDGLRIRVEDDGVGLDPARGTASGRGQGLALHTTMMAVIGGALEVESEPGAYTRVTLSLPAGNDPFVAAGWPRAST